MLLMCHLFIGLIIGLVIFQYLKDRRVIVLAAIGSILPDLIDKPLAKLYLPPVPPLNASSLAPNTYATTEAVRA